MSDTIIHFFKVDVLTGVDGTGPPTAGRVARQRPGGGVRRAANRRLQDRRWTRVYVQVSWHLNTCRIRWRGRRGCGGREHTLDPWPASSYRDSPPGIAIAGRAQ